MLLLETTVEDFGRGRGPIWMHTVASLPASRSEGDSPSIDMGVPRRLQRERGSGRSYSSGREGEKETERELPGSPGLLRSSAARQRSRPLKVQPGPLGSVSTVRISVAGLARGQWQLHHSRARRCVVVDGEQPTGPEAVGPARLVDVVPNPWKSVLSAVDVESGAAKPHHASKQTEG